jgi:hypothetical protein
MNLNDVLYTSSGPAGDDYEGTAIYGHFKGGERLLLAIAYSGEIALLIEQAIEGYTP